MKSSNVFFIIALVILSANINLFAQKRGLNSISEKELRHHLDFLGANEFRGRETPSPELEIAALYLGNWAKHTGLKPLLPDGSFFQSIPINVTSVSEPNTKLRVFNESGESVYYYAEEFGGSFYETMSSNGEIVFAGLGLVDPEQNWDDLKDLDIYGKVLVILDEQHPDHKYELGFTYSYRLSARVREIRNRGAAAVLVIASPEMEAKKKSGKKIFADIPSGRMDILFDSQRRGNRSNQNPNPTIGRPPMPFAQAFISHTVASDILGITESEVSNLFYRSRKGEQLKGKKYNSAKVQLNVEIKKEKATTRNILAIVDGTDPKLKNEYIVICAHYDHLGISDGEIIAGADDNGTGTVALMEIAQALLKEPTKRSVIIAWFTGEERGYIGSQYFINNSVVPIEKINACLNMDMLGRNHPDSLYLIGSDLLSSELDAAIHKANKTGKINFNFDYLYSNLTHPQRVYFRSDQYPHVRFGIPSVWFFCGFTHDYHTPRDINAFINYKKFLKVTKLVYLSAFEIGNMKNMLKLDVNPEVTSRGAHNLQTRSLFENIR